MQQADQPYERNMPMVFQDSRPSAAPQSCSGRAKQNSPPKNHALMRFEECQENGNDQRPIKRVDLEIQQNIAQEQPTQR